MLLLRLVPHPPLLVEHPVGVDAEEYLLPEPVILKVVDQVEHVGKGGVELELEVVEVQVSPRSGDVGEVERFFFQRSPVPSEFRLHVRVERRLDGGAVLAEEFHLFAGAGAGVGYDGNLQGALHASGGAEVLLLPLGELTGAGGDLDDPRADARILEPVVTIGQVPGHVIDHPLLVQLVDRLASGVVHHGWRGLQVRSGREYQVQIGHLLVELDDLSDVRIGRAVDHGIDAHIRRLPRERHLILHRLVLMFHRSAEAEVLVNQRDP